MACAQGTFHYKIDSLHSPYGLAVMPDSSIVAAGSWGDCLHFVRLDPAGAVLWTKKMCPLRDSDNFEKNSLQIIPGIDNGSFFVVARYRSEQAGPQHVINLMKFDASGGLIWECQLPPYISFGGQASGAQLAVSPDGSIWIVHGIGATQVVTNGVSYNHVLLFKVSPSGDLQLRNTYMTGEESSANGVFIRGNNEVFVYGGLGNLLTDGFLLKIGADGSVQWAKKYPNFYLYRDGGQFSNGDELLYGPTPGGIAFARLRPADGALVWLKKIDTYPASGLYTVAADEGIFATVKIPGAFPQSAILKCAPGAQELEWLRRYEDCTDYLVLDARATPEGGLAFTQHGKAIEEPTRLLKISPLGHFEPTCSDWDAPLPQIVDLPLVSPGNLGFSLQSGPLPLKKHLVGEFPSALRLDDVCPGGYPEADLTVPDSACAGSPARLVTSGNPNADRWEWLLPGAGPGTVEGLVAEPVVYVQEGVFPVTLIQHYGVCTDTARGSIRVAAPLQDHLFAYADTSHCLEKPFVASPLPGDFDAWQWDDGSTDSLRFFDPAVEGTFRLTALKGLCRATDSITLRLTRCEDGEVFVPNVFAPDSPGGNARWAISVHPNSTLLSCSVYDRWGALLYSTAEGEMPLWDGNYRGRRLPAGVYGWVIRFRKSDGTEEVRFGNLSLLR